MGAFGPDITMEMLAGRVGWYPGGDRPGSFRPVVIAKGAAVLNFTASSSMAFRLVFYREGF